MNKSIDQYNMFSGINLMIIFFKIQNISIIYQSNSTSNNEVSRNSL